MAEQQTGRTRPPSETSGSAQRPAHHLAGPTLTFDLGAELEQLRREQSYQAGDRNAVTLVKGPDLRVVLTVVKEGARLREHEVPGSVTVQTLAGRLRVHTRDEAYELPQSTLLTFGGGVAHDVEALEESAFLVTIAWPEGRPDGG